MIRVDEEVYDGRRIILYVIFVMTLLAGVFAADVMIRAQAVITTAVDSTFPSTTAEDDDEEEFEEETASRSMIG